jgi:hypothetical protein
LNSTNKTDNFLQEFDLGTFLTQNKHLSGESFLLRDKGSTNFEKALLANQLNLYTKVKHKLPTFHQMHCWVSPKSFEQCSSELSAKFKSSLFKGKSMLDLSGGLGVDDWAFSKNFETIISLDPDDALNELVKVNYQKLGVTNIERLTMTAEDFLKKHHGAVFDLIFLDADRRNPLGKDYSLEGGLPSYPTLANQLFTIAQQIVLKLSPMIDLTYLKEKLTYLEKIIVVGDKQEVKEILALIRPGFNGKISTEAYVLDQTETNLKWPQQKGITLDKNKPGDYLVEAHNVLVKSELAHDYLTTNGAALWGKSGILGIFRFEPNDWMGRIFMVKQTMPYQKATFKAYLKDHQIKKANFNRRNFPATVEELRKTFVVTEGGDDYFFFSSQLDGSLIFCHCKKCD